MRIRMVKIRTRIGIRLPSQHVWQNLSILSIFICGFSCSFFARKVPILNLRLGDGFFSNSRLGLGLRSWIQIKIRVGFGSRFVSTLLPRGDGSDPGNISSIAGLFAAKELEKNPNPKYQSYFKTEPDSNPTNPEPNPLTWFIFLTNWICFL